MVYACYGQDDEGNETVELVLTKSSHSNKLLIIQEFLGILRASRLNNHDLSSTQ